MNLPDCPKNARIIFNCEDSIVFSYWDYYVEDCLKDAQKMIDSSYSVSFYWEDAGSFHEPIIYLYLVVGKAVGESRICDLFCKERLSKRIVYPSMTISEIRKSLDNSRSRLSRNFKMSRRA